MYDELLRTEKVKPSTFKEVSAQGEASKAAVLKIQILFYKTRTFLMPIK
jgi:hypothetical protein